jgi:hypothetical protein
MDKLENILKSITESSSKTTIRGRLEDAIKNRYPVSFFYKGPPNEVLPGRRVKVELVASGLTKKGNLAVRGYVQPPSTSKKGFKEHGWRIFLINRISPGSLNVYSDEQFNEKRPQYKEGDDSSFSVTYVKTNWGTIKEPKISEPTPQEPEIKIEKPQTDELPQPKPKEKPNDIIPDNKKSKVLDNLKTKVKIINNEKQITPDDFINSVSELYKTKIEDWKIKQQEIGGNLTPGEGTRRKFEKETELELFSFINKENIKIKETEEDIETNEILQEEIKKIKGLIFY